MTIVDILIIIALIILAFYLGFRLGYFYHSMRIISVLEENLRRFDQHTQQLNRQVETINTDSISDILATARNLHLNTVRYEVHNEQHLMYSYSNGEFLCQGNSLDDTVANLIKIKLGDTLVVDSASNRGFFIIDGKIRHDLEAIK
jgi:hypothetical protein